VAQTDREFFGFGLIGFTLGRWSRQELDVPEPNVLTETQLLVFARASLSAQVRHAFTLIRLAGGRASPFAFRIQDGSLASDERTPDAREVERLTELGAEGYSEQIVDDPLRVFDQGRGQLF